MIPSVLSSQVRQGVDNFLRTTFPISTPEFHGIVDRLIEREGGIFKGPYLSINLPFRQGTAGADYFPEVPLAFPPYLHQELAFKRLGAADPRSTIVATGTGSGKTESFLQPILEYCRRHRGEKGIKAILIYPMNALATDQAGRIAKTIWRNDSLKSYVTAGLYVGDREGHPHLHMGPDQIITDRESIRKVPPDILLTNYKMLDYLLLRADDRTLWASNAPDTLRFLVVDELHTFDGAQGSDLACLIRRLKKRLKTPDGHLCCVGTSATLGGSSGTDDLRTYAEEVFGETFDNESVITESRVTAGEYLEGNLIDRTDLVSVDKVAALRPETHEAAEDYIRAQARLWFDLDVPDDGIDSIEWRLTLGDLLRGHIFFRNLLTVLGGQPRTYEEVLHELRRVSRSLRDGDEDYQRLVLDSMVALVSTARVKLSLPDESEGAIIRPFLDVRVQLWLRELRRMVASLDAPPELEFSDDLTSDARKRHLPLIHCRECGSTGWGATKRSHDDHLDPDLKKFYETFFGNGPTLAFVFPLSARDALGLDGTSGELCPDCLTVSPSGRNACLACGSERLRPVFLPNIRVTRSGKSFSDNKCPFCDAPAGLTVLGSRAASLTSVLIAQLFSSTYNDDKKLLTFSDSVQDAAHRAGFFGARTYGFTFRSALQQFVQAGGQGLQLSELPAAFTSYWWSKLTDLEYLSTFIAPNMTWFDDYENLINEGSLQAGSALKEDVNRRLSWEVFSEYGFRSRIGRTLERTGSSVIGLDADLLSETASALLEPLQNEVGGLRDISQAELRSFLIGLVARLKNEGGIFHPEAGAYVENGGRAYLLGRKPYMPGFGPRSRTPIFLTSRPGSKFDLLLSQGRSRTWYEKWMIKAFRNHPAVTEDSAAEVYPLALGALVQGGILEARSTKNGLVWGLRPDALRVHLDVSQLRCDTCGHNVSVPSHEEPTWEATSCLRFRCTGTYVDDGAQEDDYYRKLYATSDIQRIFTAEHTGMLKRDAREAVEKAFMGGERKPWDPNLLSCTPTLEMGIDIGDLSSVVLCSVPPARANYLQRIGRAGRRDGNALNMTVANSRPHDLYFFAEPQEMLAGHVETPKVYLQAPTVLQRQLTAYCFDRWIESDDAGAAVPKKLGRVLDNLEPYSEDRFPYNFLSFLEQHHEALFNGFVGMFGGELSEDAVSLLSAYFRGDTAKKEGLRYRMTNALHEMRQEQQSLRRKVKSLAELIRKIEKDPAAGKQSADEAKELRHERAALNKVVSLIRDQSPYNFLTNEGLLPNYAFPEAGVTLRSLIWRKTKGDGEKNFETIAYEYERPAVSAIHELAPSSHFYAEGRKVRVDQIDLQVSEAEDWRFCDQCTYAERIIGHDHKKSCPRCGSGQWSDVGQRHQMIRMRQVIATTSDRDSRLGDDSDDRDPVFYKKQMLVDFENDVITDAFRIDADDLPFGFEFLGKATFREVNFGEQDARSNGRVRIAGQELITKGFGLCSQCGKVQSEKGEIKHAGWCPSRGKSEKDDVADFLYLYREFSSEAIRILLPVGSFEGADNKLHSFIAALQLGLKERFGRVDHLQTTLQEEPVSGSAIRKRYLVLYDTVPGGTGYLKQLMKDSHPMMDVLERALHILEGCSCNGTDKDGCYRCLYAYRNSFDMPHTSRSVAGKLLRSILEHKDSIERVPALRGISINALVESELEGMFIEGLRRVRIEKGAVELQNDVVRGKPGWLLKIGDHSYRIEPQVQLGAEQGVFLQSRADFVIWPTRDGQKPIALFTDGFQFHRDRIALDLAQRSAIAASGKYHVWSLTWSDVVSVLTGEANACTNYLNANPTLAKSIYAQFYGGKTSPIAQALTKEGSFAWFVRFLQEPDEDEWRKTAIAHLLATIGSLSENEPLTTVGLPQELVKHLEVDDPALRGSNEADPVMRLVLAWRKEAATRGDTADLRCLAQFDDEEIRSGNDGFERHWTGFLRLTNLLHFIPGFVAVAESALGEELYGGWESTYIDPSSASERVADAAWEELLELSLPDVHPLVTALAEGAAPVPVSGFELTDGDGLVLAEAELAWPDERIAVLTNDQADHAVSFEAQGWTLFTPADDPNAVLEALFADVERNAGSEIIEE